MSQVDHEMAPAIEGMDAVTLLLRNPTDRPLHAARSSLGSPTTVQLSAKRTKARKPSISCVR
jgi:hypothetical protein